MLGNTIGLKNKSFQLLSAQYGLQYSSTRQHRWKGLLFSIGTVGVSTLIMFTLKTEPYNVNMVFMLLTLMATVWFGLAAGFVTAVAGFLCFNYFFIPPLFTFVVDAGQGWTAVFLFFGTALLANQVAGRARLSSRAAQQRAQEATALYELATAVLTRVDQTEMLMLVLQKVSQELGTASCSLFLWEPEAGGGHLVESTRLEALKTSEIALCDRHPDPAIAQAVFQQNRAAFFPAENNLTEPGGYSEESGFKARPVLPKKAVLRGPVAYLPLAYGSEVLGVMTMVGYGRADQPDFSPEERRIIQVFSNHVALAVEHARLIREAAQVATLRDSDKLKTALLDSVSHELRTPLTSIKTATANLQAKDIDWAEEERDEFLGVIEQETNRLTRLVANLLELSKIEGGALKPNWGWHYLPEIVEQVVGRLKYNPVMKDHPVTTHFGPDIPLSRMDYLQIDQVLTNLLDNAAKYSPPGKAIVVEVEVISAQAVAHANRTGASPVAGRPRPPMLSVKVLDEGRGIPPAELERIFDKFYRVRTSTNPLTVDAPGTGIGLAITKGIVEAHGGTIRAQNRLYGGSIFEFVLPLVPLPPDEETLADDQ